jgi:predicted transcriptional regulator of viral defense system
MKNNTKAFFEKNNGVAPMGLLLKNGINHYQINHLLLEGLVIKLKHGVYKWKNEHENEWEDIAHIVPYGVVCLYTACLHYELSTFVASEYHMAIHRKAKIVLPSYPPIQLHYWDTQAFNIGITSINIHNATLKIYDIEKTVCDIIRFRHKVGMEITKEVLKNYLTRSDRDIAKLNEYARQLNIATILHNFLSVLV